MIIDDLQISLFLFANDIFKKIESIINFCKFYNIIFKDTKKISEI